MDSSAYLTPPYLKEARPCPGYRLPGVLPLQRPMCDRYPPGVSESTESQGGATGQVNTMGRTEQTGEFQRSI